MTTPWNDDYQDKTGRLARFAQLLPPGTIWGLLLLSGGMAGATLYFDDQAPFLGAASAIAAAVSAAGFVLRDRPRRLLKSYKSLVWDDGIAGLKELGLIDYESEATGAWVLPQEKHRKGVFPFVRVATRHPGATDWNHSFVADTAVTPEGTIVVSVHVTRVSDDDGTDLMLIVV